MKFILTKTSNYKNTKEHLLETDNLSMIEKQ